MGSVAEVDAMSPDDEVAIVRRVCDEMGNGLDGIPGWILDQLATRIVYELNRLGYL